MPNASGVELWRGPSRITGANVVAIATFRSANRKTGPMVQTWILGADVDPVTAVRTGADVAICGGCPFRGDGTGKRRACYVNVGQAPRGVWAAWKRGRYPRAADVASDPKWHGRPWRLGAYGDPAAVPLAVWTQALAEFRATGHTGYTHQWRNAKLRDTLQVCQASVESEDDVARLARLAGGAGYFRVAPKGAAAPLRGEVLCPATTGADTTCADCMACNGRNGARVLIEAHGTGATHVTRGRTLRVL